MSGVFSSPITSCGLSYAGGMQMDSTDWLFQVILNGAHLLHAWRLCSKQSQSCSRLCQRVASSKRRRKSNDESVRQLRSSPASNLFHASSGLLPSERLVQSRCANSGRTLLPRQTCTKCSWTAPVILFSAGFRPRTPRSTGNWLKSDSISSHGLAYLLDPRFIVEHMDTDTESRVEEFLPR